MAAGGIPPSACSGEGTFAEASDPDRSGTMTLAEGELPEDRQNPGALRGLFFALIWKAILVLIGLGVWQLVRRLL